MLKYTGRILIIVSVVITCILWWLSKPDLESVTAFPLISLAQLAALNAVVLLGFQFLLATRLRFLEKIFGGLDKIYILHHLLGGIAFVLMLLHPLLQVFDNIKSPQVLKYYLFPSDQLPHSLGVGALYGFTTLMFITLYMKLPYRLWRQTHIFMGVPLLIVSLHIALITSDITIYMPLRYWVLMFVSLAYAAFIYKRFLYGRFSPHYDYKIKNVIQQTAIWSVALEPIGKAMNFKPGQFAFLQFDNPGVLNDKHPFSMASDPDSSIVEFSMKDQGPFTNSLANLQQGNLVKLYGPHGEFFDKYMATHKDLVWIAGGIGITPFLSMLKTEARLKSGRKIWLYYCVKNEEEAVFDWQIKELAKDIPNFVYRKHLSSVSGHCNADMVLKDDAEIKNKAIMICGPTRMMHDLNTQFLQKGFKSFNIVFEDFTLLP